MSWDRDGKWGNILQATSCQANSSCFHIAVSPVLDPCLAIICIV